MSLKSHHRTLQLVPNPLLLSILTADKCNRTERAPSRIDEGVVGGLFAREISLLVPKLLVHCLIIEWGLLTRDDLRVTGIGTDLA
jgi:hypothetical protein